MNLLPSILRCLLLDGVDEAGVKMLVSKDVEVHIGPTGPSAEELIEIIKKFTPTAVIVRSATKVNARVLDAMAFCVRIIGRAGVGVDNIDMACAKEHGILVINAPLGNTLSAAEHTCAIILSMSRQLPLTQVRNPECWRTAKYNASEMPILEVSGKTLGLLGLGRIGSLVGSRLHAFGMHVIGCDPNWDYSKPLPDWLSRHCSLDEVLVEADYISLHLPLLPSTKNVINEVSLSKCKRGVRIINCSRGGVVDEKAVLAGLNSGQCGFLGLDVLEQEPPSLDNATICELMQRRDVIITPHIGASSYESQVGVSVEVCDSILAIGGLSISPSTGLESGLNLNHIGLSVMRILQASGKSNFLRDFKRLCDLIIIGALYISMDPFVPALSSFKAVIHFNSTEEEINVLSGVLKPLLADLLFRRQDVFPDVLKALVIEPKEDDNSLILQPFNDDKLAILDLVCEGEGVTVSKRLAMVPKEKGHSIHLIEKDNHTFLNFLDIS